VAADVGLSGVGLDSSPSQLSDGYKRRLALAVQLARKPSVLLLDEPLAGLDWRARRDVAALLGQLKRECTLLVVSHDLRELTPMVSGTRCKRGPSFTPAPECRHSCTFSPPFFLGGGGDLADCKGM
jgi:energy-coupling factor transporter ATP-binding protein EcfA2